MDKIIKERIDDFIEKHVIIGISMVNETYIEGIPLRYIKSDDDHNESIMELEIYITTDNFDEKSESDRYIIINLNEIAGIFLTSYKPDFNITRNKD